MGRIIRCWMRFFGARRRGPRPGRKLVPAAPSLEGRELPSLGVVSVSVAPAADAARVARLVPVKVSGVFRESRPDPGTGTTIHGEWPGPKSANVQVVDEERRHQPSGPVTLVDLGGGLHAYRFTLYLEGSRSPSDWDGRQYFVTVAGRDAEGSDGRTIPVRIAPAPGEPDRLQALIRPEAGQFDQHAQSRAALRALVPVAASPSSKGIGSPGGPLGPGRRPGR